MQNPCEIRRFLFNIALQILRMKPLLPCLLFLFLSCVGKTQKPYDPAKISFFTLAFLSPSNAKPQPGITVIDKRFDTSKIGFGLEGTKNKTIRLDGGVATGVQRYLNGNAEAATPAFVVVLRNLWLQELKAGELREADEDIETKNISRCTAKFDVYALEDGYCRALLRIDTVLETSYYLKQAGAGLLADVLDYTLVKISALNVKEATARKTPVKLNDLLRLYEQKMTLPRLTNDTLQRCVYMTYEDFAQKRPSPLNFVLEQDEGGDFLYLNENNEKRLLTDFWGFCDGRFHFVKVGANFFPLVREYNAYSFLGCLQPVHRSQPRSRNRVSRYALFGVFGELHQTKLVKFLRPMQLDMETGKPL